jgi:hypothetical protein
MKPEQFQLIAMAIGPVATLIVVMLGVLFQNRHVDVRISDLTRSMDLRFADSKETLRAEMRADFAELRAEMRAQHSDLLAKFADLDTRLARIESERRIVQ